MGERPLAAARMGTLSIWITRRSSLDRSEAIDAAMRFGERARDRSG